MRLVLTIRRKLLILVVLASLPALCLALYSGLTAGDEALRRTEREAEHISRDLALRQQQITASTRQFLTILARLDMVRRLDAAACQPLFRELLDANPVYSDILLADLSGRIRVSGRGATPDVDLSEVWHFREALRGGGFTVGKYRKSPTTGLNVLVCALPVYNSAGVMTGILSSGVRLDSFDELAQGLDLPKGATVFLADRDGTRLYNRHFPDPRPDIYPVGGKVTIQQRGVMEGAAARGPFYITGLDGLRRLYVVQESRLESGDSPYLYLGVSVPQRSILETARQAMLANLALLLLSALLSSALAWVVGRRVFVERIDRLERVAGRFAAGDLEARSHLPPPLMSGAPDELGRLGLAMDRIGEELSRRGAERQATLERLARTQYAVDHAGDEIYWTGEDGRFLYANEQALRSLGYTREQLSSLGVLDVDADFTPQRRQELLQRLAAGETVNFETRHRTREGTLVPKEITASLVQAPGERIIFSTARDIRERKRHEAVLRSILDDTAALTGQEFLDTLTRRLLAVLGVQAVFLGEYLDNPPTRMRAMSMASTGGPADSREVDLKSSPGADIPDGGHLFLPEGTYLRYPGSPYLSSMRIEGYLGVPVQDATGLRLGHMAIMDRRPMSSDQALLPIMRLFALRAAGELARMRAERETLASLREKEVLLKEIHHRVKNNLQIVSSLLVLQARDITDPVALDLLDQSRARIMSMALVHEDLYQTGNLAWVDFRHYLGRLAERLGAGMSGQDAPRFELDLEELNLSVDQAIPLGLLCNELITNALKHAFALGRPGCIRLSLRKGDGEAVLTVRDDGRGLPEDFDPAQGATLGLQLVWSLAQQLHGEASAENDGGAVFRVRLPLG